MNRRPCTGVIVKNMAFRVGQTLTVVGAPKPDATDFQLNIGPDEQEIAFHICPRFTAHGEQHTLVCNTYEKGNWCEEQREGGFPFCQGKEFKIVIRFTQREFQVTFSDGSQIHFPNRMGADTYSYICFDEKVGVTSFEIK